MYDEAIKIDRKINGAYNNKNNFSILFLSTGVSLRSLQ